MIDPSHSLAFSIQANPGVYAVLLGSGVSRAGKIPTGWEITIDQIRRRAALLGEKDIQDPERWYWDKFDEEANYSGLLATVAKTKFERQGILRAYIEPNDQEREHGEKQPTAAHHAIAALVRQGFVKVVITTNFDRLIEIALQEAGIAPKVLSTPDEVEGMLPLIHTRCCVFKVHGDYQDPNIRNTPDELAEYPSQFNSLLGRILDEFGLIICGWSGEWDIALRNAICRAPSRRFMTYWAARGIPGEEANRLIKHRGAQLIQIENADAFFQKVQRDVESINTFSHVHPLSTKAAVASLEHYLSESRYRIQLANLVSDTVGSIIETTSGKDFDMYSPEPTTESVVTRLRSYDAACETLLAMAFIGGRWAEEQHTPVWQQGLQRLAIARLREGKVAWLGLQRYPATLLLYALALGAVEANRFHFLNTILSTEWSENYQAGPSAGRDLVPSLGKYSWGGEVKGHMNQQQNHWLRDTLSRISARTIPDKERYELVFDKLEILMGLNIAYHKGDGQAQQWYWIENRGADQFHQTRKRAKREIEASLHSQGDHSPFVASRLFGNTKEQCESVLNQLMSQIWWLQ